VGIRREREEGVSSKVERLEIERTKFCSPEAIVKKEFHPREWA
jgi:hypothetical protein